MNGTRLRLKHFEMRDSKLVSRCDRRDLEEKPMFVAKYIEPAFEFRGVRFGEQHKLCTLRKQFGFDSMSKFVVSKF